MRALIVAYSNNRVIGIGQVVDKFIGEMLDVAF